MQIRRRLQGGLKISFKDDLEPATSQGLTAPIYMKSDMEVALTIEAIVIQFSVSWNNTGLSLIVFQGNKIVGAYIDD